jgi:hypothetical protein
MNLSADGIELRPYADGPMVRAVDLEVARKEFYKDHPADGDTDKQKQDARRKAFARALKDAKDAGLIGTRDIDGIQYVWLARTEPAS